MREPIGKIIGRLRAERGETLEEVAKGAGTSKGHVWEMEKGDSDNPTLNMLVGLARHFSVPIDLFTGEALPAQSDPLWPLWHKLKQIDKRDWPIVEAVIAAILERKRKEGK